MRAENIDHNVLQSLVAMKFGVARGAKAEAARYLEVTPNYFSMMLNGRHTVSAAVVNKLLMKSDFEQAQVTAPGLMNVLPGLHGVHFDNMQETLFDEIVRHAKAIKPEQTRETVFKIVCNLGLEQLNAVVMKEYEARGRPSLGETPQEMVKRMVDEHQASKNAGKEE